MGATHRISMEFDKHRSKERGRYIGKFLGKIDESKKLSIFTKHIRAHLMEKSQTLFFQIEHEIL